MNRPCYLTAALVATLGLSACGAGSGEGLDERGLPLSTTDPEQPAPETPTPEDPAASGVEFETLQSTIFTPICSRCHQGSGAPQGLRLDSADTSYQFLVGVSSGERPDLLRVNPNNPDDSYLVMKLEGNPGIVGGRMPLNGTPLSTEVIGQVRDWIADGALRQSAVTAASVSQVHVSAEAIKVRFSQSLSADQNPAESVQIFTLESDEPRWLDASTYQVTQSSTQALEIHLERGNATRYQLQINSPGLPALMDANGLFIDGDSDQQPGGTFTYNFD